jgi:drug/metabolite transporter (DMT)-like permease
MRATDIVIWISAGAASVFALILLFHGIGSWDRTFVLVVSIEVVTFTVASLLYVQAVTLSPLSLTIPFLGFTPVVSVVVAMLVLQEVPSPAGFMGIALVVLGAIALEMGESRSWSDLFRAPLREPGSWRMLLVAVIWGTTTSLDKIAIRHGSEALLAFSLSAGSALLLLAIRMTGLVLRDASDGDQMSWRNQETLPFLLLAACVAAAAVLCQFFAYRELLVAYVETIKRAGGLLSVLIGVFGFREGGLANRVPAAVLMLIGSALIMLLD